ncbi:MAG TPA: hypothetical protein VNK25_00520 [Candidatus Nitrosotenuis sp.]|nr:hypothetical protein [Candidatus Nitrosotenuis sp.]
MFAKKILYYLTQDANLIRKKGAVTLTYLMVHSKTPFWILDRYRGLIPELFEDIHYDRRTQTYMAENPIVQEKTVDPNTLDPTLQQ